MFAFVPSAVFFSNFQAHQRSFQDKDKTKINNLYKIALATSSDCVSPQKTHWCRFHPRVCCRIHNQDGFYFEECKLAVTKRSSFLHISCYAWIEHFLAHLDALKAGLPIGCLVPIIPLELVTQYHQNFHVFTFKTVLFSLGISWINPGKVVTSEGLDEGMNQYLNSCLRHFP